MSESPAAAAAYRRVGPEVREMFGSIAGRYDLANTVLSFGMHHLWRRAMLREVKSDYFDCALDLCTGTGDLLKPLSRKAKQVVGVDFCLPMLRVGESKASAGRRAPTALVQGDALRLPFS